MVQAADKDVLPCRAMKETAELQGTPISIDTFDAEVAAEAVAAGAHMVNDVSGGLMDPNMHAQVSSCGHLSCNALCNASLAWCQGSNLCLGIA